MNDGLTNLKKELDNFYEISKTINVKFEGVGEHDDHVNAMMLSLFYLYDMLNIKYEINIEVPKSQSPTP